MNACSARKRAGVLYPHPSAACHLRPGYSSAIYHPHRIEASSVTSVNRPFRTWQAELTQSVYGGKAELADAGVDFQKW